MTIEQADMIDLVATKPEDSVTRLVITDHLDWGDEHAHLIALQNKLNAYLAFVESGQLTQEFPGSIGKVVRIEVAFLHDPPESTKADFLSRATGIVETRGMSLTRGLHSAPP